MNSGNDTLNTLLDGRVCYWITTYPREDDRPKPLFQDACIDKQKKKYRYQWNIQFMIPSLIKSRALLDLLQKKCKQHECSNPSLAQAITQTPRFGQDPFKNLQALYQFPRLANLSWLTALLRTLNCYTKSYRAFNCLYTK